MSRIVYMLLIANLSVMATACAVDGQGEQGSLSEAANSAALSAPGADAVGQAGSGSFDAADLAAVTQSDANLSPRTCTTITMVGGACPGGFACLYQDANLQGFAVGISSGCSIVNLGTVNFNDKMSSWVNVSGRSYCWWVDAGFSGKVHAMVNDAAVNLVLPQENDKASSFGPC